MESDSKRSSWSISTDHPLSIELTSLRSALSHYQNAAHSASIQLQGRSLEASLASERAKRLEQTNASLESELHILRAHGRPTPAASGNQVAELTLALRRLSSRLDETEKSLLDRTREAKEAEALRVKAEQQQERLRKEVDALRAGFKEVRQRETDVRMKEKELMADRRLLEDYAKSVPSAAHGEDQSHIQFDSDMSSPKPTTYSFPEARHALLKLMHESSSQTTRLESELAEALSLLEVREEELQAEQQAAQEARERASQAEAALDVARADDRAAAGLIDRYMKFSQSTTDALHGTLSGLQTRHASTFSSLQYQLTQANQLLSRERERSESLRRAMDELTRDIVLHAEGRRREIGMRLKLIEREERWVNEFRRWIGGVTRDMKRAKQQNGDAAPHVLPPPPDLESLVAGANGLLERLEGSHIARGEEAPFTDMSQGSIARIIAAEEAIAAMVAEVSEETMKRMTLEREKFGLQRWQMSESDSDITLLEPMPRPLIRPNAKALERELPSLPQDLLGSAEVNDHAVPTHGTTSATEVKSTKLTINGGSSAGTKVTTSISPLLPPPSERDDSPRAGIDSEHEEQLPADGEDPSMQNSAVDRPIVPSTPASIADILNGDADLMSLEDPSDLSSPTDPVVFEPIRSTGMPLDEPRLPGSSLVKSNAADTSASPLEETVSPAEMESAVAVGLGLPTSHIPPASPHSVVVEKTEDVDPDAEFNRNPSSSILAVGASTLEEGADESTTASFASLSTSNRSYPEGAALMDGLVTMSGRYDTIQRAFKGCHTTLSLLKADLTSAIPSGFSTSSPHHDQIILLSSAVSRLDDITEDARVSLEIHIFDDLRVAKGYETLLSMSAPGSDSARLHIDVEAFITGEDPSGRKAREGFEKKLDDLEHDIAVIKRAVHETLMGSARLDTDEQQTPDAARPSNSPWGWTAALFPTSRPSSPAPPTPTFGAVMSSSTSAKSKSLSNAPRFPTFSPSPVTPSHVDPFASLGLRHSMPSHPSLLSSSSPSFPIMPSGSSPLRPSPSFLGLHHERPRTTSGYLAGLGGAHSLRGSRPITPALQAEQRRQSEPLLHNNQPLVPAQSNNVDDVE